MIAWLKALLVNGRTIYAAFSAFRTNTNVCIQYNSQTASLEAFIRMKMNNNGINIVNDFSDIEPAFDFYLNEDQAAQYEFYLIEAADPSYIFYVAEEANATLFFDFIVEVPSALMSEEIIIKAWLNKVKLIGKRYKIVYY